MHRWRLSAALGTLLAITSPTAAADGPLHGVDLEGHDVDLLQASPHAKAIVLLFTTTECPISNRYAPEMRRLFEAYSARGVAFWLVYPNPADAAASIREHMKAYNLPMRAVRDPQQTLVKRAQATVTPEAAIVDGQGALLYHGRIDDRYAEIGVDRQNPGKRDLQDNLSAVLSGAPIREPVTRAVGCFLIDFLR